MGLIGRRYTAAMPSRPVLIGRGLVTHPPHTFQQNVPRVHYPESEPTTHPTTKGHTGPHVHNRTTVHNVTAAIAAGKHPDPSRTRKLSQPAPMVLHPIGCGRVGRRRTIFPEGATARWPLRGISVAFRWPFGGMARTCVGVTFFPQVALRAALSTAIACGLRRCRRRPVG